jgi:hypothetical protein
MCQTRQKGRGGIETGLSSAGVASHHFHVVRISQPATRRDEAGLVIAAEDSTLSTDNPVT